MPRGRRTTSEIFNIGGWSNPSWIGDDKVLMFDGSETFTGDTLIYTVGGSGTQTWFEDSDLTLVGGEVDASQTRLAATDGTVIRLYRLDAPPPALPVFRCVVSGGEGAIFRPTWSPDGSTAGLAAGRRHLRDAGQPRHLRGRERARGPGRRRRTGARPAPGRRLTATAPKRIGPERAAEGAEAAGELPVHRHRDAAAREEGRSARRRRRSPRSTTFKVKPNRAGKARLRRGGKSVSVRLAGGGRFVTRKVKIVR